MAWASAVKMLDDERSRSLSKAKADKLPAEELVGKIVTGVLHDDPEAPEYQETYAAAARAQAEAAAKARPWRWRVLLWVTRNERRAVLGSWAVGRPGARRRTQCWCGPASCRSRFSRGPHRR